MLGYVVAQMEQQKTSWVQRRTSGTFRSSGAGEVGLAHASGRHRARRCVASAQARKSRADRFAYSDNIKGRSSGVILVVIRSS